MKSILLLIRLLLVAAIISLVSCGGGSSGGTGKSTVSQSSVNASSVPASSSVPQTSSSMMSSSSLSNRVKVTISVIGNGKVGIAETLLIEPGEYLEIPIVPDEGYFIVSVSGCPGSYTLNGYKTDTLVEDCALEIKFDEDIVEPIADPGLKRLVKEALGLAETDVLTARKMWSLEHIYTGLIDKEKNIAEVWGIEHAKNLASLNIFNTIEDEVANISILDVSPLLELGNLTALQISNIQIKDLSHLSNLNKLFKLELKAVALKDINFLASFKELRMLDLSYNDIRDISVLKELDNISYLNLAGNKIDSAELNVLKGKRIRDLILGFNPIETLEFLRGNLVLNQLDIDGTMVSSLDPLLDTGLGSNSILFVRSTCLVYSNKHVDETLKDLLERGVEIYETPFDFAYEAETNSYMLADECPARNVQITTNINANYNENGSLSIDWNLSGNLDERTLYCAVYANMELQQLREPLVNIENCPLAGNKIIDGFPYANEDLHFIFSDGYGIYRNILVKPVKHRSLGPMIQAIDWGQTVIGANPRLVQNRAALLRVHVVSSMPTPVPNVDLELVLNGQSKIIRMKKPARLPRTKRYQTLSDSYFFTVPKEWVKPGLILKVTLEGEEPRVLQPVINEKTDLYLTVVPIDILGEVAELPTEKDIQSVLKGFWPLSDVITRIHPGLKSKVTTEEGMWGLLSELEELRALENSSAYYYGFFSSSLYRTMNNIPYGGIAYRGGYSGLGHDRTDKNGYMQVWAATMLHEIGHNFSLNHIPCGDPLFYDVFYPYPAETIGSLGVSSDLQNLYQPERYDAGGYADIMSYCRPRHVSDYSFMKAQDYLALHPPKSFSSSVGMSAKTKLTSAVVDKSLYISGEISSSGAVTLRRIIPVHQPLVEQAVGDYRIVVSSKGGVQTEQSFSVNELDHATKDSPQFFSVKIPLVDIISLEIFYKGHSIFQQTNQSTGGLAQKQSFSIVVAPELHETGSSVCATWPTQQYKSASLLLQQGEGASVIFIDDESGDMCVSTAGLLAGGEWHLTLRNNLDVEQVIVAR